MTYKQIASMIASIGLPFAYYQFPDDTKQAPPFICFLYDYDDIYADNLNYVGRVTLMIELYTAVKDFAFEASVEDVLKNNGFSYGKTATYIDNEKMWQVVYTMEVFING